MTTPTDTASIARRQVHLETLETIAELVGEFVLAIVRMANDPAMDVGQAPELLGRSGNRLGEVRERLRKARRDAIEACSRIDIPSPPTSTAFGRISSRVGFMDLPCDGRMRYM